MSYFVLKYKMNKITNEFLLAGDKFMPEIILKHSGFTYCYCKPLTKNKEIIKELKD